MENRFKFIFTRFFLSLRHNFGLVCVAYPNIFAQNITLNNPNFLILTQIDSWPRCENFIVLSRVQESQQIEAIRDWIEQEHLEGAFNKLEKVVCNRIM